MLVDLWHERSKSINVPLLHKDDPQGWVLGPLIFPGGTVHARFGPDHQVPWISFSLQQDGWKANNDNLRSSTNLTQRKFRNHCTDPGYY